MRSPRQPRYRLLSVFRRVIRFCARTRPELARTRLILCNDIERERVERGKFWGKRSFMHTGHVPRTICTAAVSDRLPVPNLVGLFLHEISHGFGRRDDVEADRYCLRVFGIPIQYRGPLVLEWVSPALIRNFRI